MTALYPLSWRARDGEEREAARLQLVALASEVAVLTAVLDEILTPVSQQPRVRELLEACWEHRRIALEILSTDTPLHRFPRVQLEHACRDFEQRLGEVTSLGKRAHAQLNAGLQFSPW